VQEWKEIREHLKEEHCGTPDKDNECKYDSMNFQDVYYQLKPWYGQG